MPTIKLSVVVCVYNEEENIKPQIQRIAEALEGYEYEMVFVDDGSKDNTLKELYSVEHPRLRVVELKKNYGQSLALMAGIDYAQGEYIATMDGDLQNDPSDLPRMLKIAEEEGFDMVAGNRANRKDGMVLRKIPSRIANYIIRSTTDVHLKDYGCALKVLKADLAKDLGLYGELHRFVPVLAHLEGARITQVDVKHHARQFGKSKYGLSRTFKVVSDLLLMLFFKKYMQKPMHLFGNAGVFLFVSGLLINLYLLVLKLMGEDIWGRPLIILGMMLLFGGIQFITIGIVVEIQMRTYFESQQKKPYKVRRVKGF
ncbi:MAG: glycosyltransferase family 2 protein [Haliscomenobacter sp.]|uniref:glycosyltransferase family 2 protein n=1 Tax=Haliscomenobacter sp. TaxID=2717303 RepID=UPI0029B0C6E6|nr:glycosyltransferase family 2 protein [Haliscomenobacter sp.]MDX2071951.1 glycosyltransferase family 2 protein [Haliscomenobacter sp.]